MSVFALGAFIAAWYGIDACMVCERAVRYLEDDDDDDDENSGGEDNTGSRETSEKGDSEVTDGRTDGRRGMRTPETGGCREWSTGNIFQKI